MMSLARPLSTESASRILGLTGLSQMCFRGVVVSQRVSTVKFTATPSESQFISGLQGLC